MNSNDMPKGLRVRGGRLYYYYHHKGKPHYRSTGLKAIPANVANAAEMRRAEIEAHKFGIDSDEVAAEDFKTGTFASVAQEFLDAADVKASTRHSYRQLLQIYWMPSLQHRQIARIQLPTLRKINRDTNWSSRKVQKNAISAMRQVFEFAQHEGYRDDNPAQKLTIKRRKSETRNPDPYTVDERDGLLDWLEANASAETHAYFMTAFLTGMRTGELLALTWADYDGKSLAVTKARVRGEVTTTKTDENRTVLVQERLAKTLNGLPSRFRQGVIFTNQYGREYRAGYHLNKKFREAHEKAGVRHREGPYPWRHTYASIGLTSGADPAWLANQLGHSLQVFYSVYSKWINTDERDSRELEKLL